ncbi:MAG: branched-chain amino acid ABC transporter permease [Deltaproteobacteria bacterium]|nr:branched-chain amino acid ABC transporter permease [Deltaproteobacteria bacterium]
MLITEIMIMGIFALSFNLLFGYTGLLSFGHAAFFGVSGYVTAFLLIHDFPSLLLALLLGTLAAALAAIVVGYFSVRLDEIYFAILTLGFGMMFYTLVHQWRSVTGGSDGLTGLVLPSLGIGKLSIDVSSPKSFYFIVAVFFIITILVLLRIVRSSFGLILMSIRENKERAAFTGINIRAYRLASFVISGFFAGVAGGLFAVFDRMASPSMLHWTASAEPVLMTVLGGAHVFFGPVIGAILFFFIEHVITKFTDIWMIFLGAILIPLVIFFPDGVLGTLMTRRKKMREARREGEE